MNRAIQVYFVNVFLILIGFYLLMVTGCDTIEPGPIQRGPAWIVYTQENSPLIYNDINAITIDGEGNKWFATDSGVSKLSRGSWERIDEMLEFETVFGVSRKVNAIAVAPDRSVWFGLGGGGVRRFNRYNPGLTWTSFTTPALLSNLIYSIAADVSGNIWVGTFAGVSRFIPNAADPSVGIWKQYTSENSPLPDEPIRSIALNPNDYVIWFGTSSQGVVSFDGDFDWNIDAPSDLPFPILSMGFDYSNIAWFGTFADWVYRYSISTAEWTHYADSSRGGGLAGNFVYAVAIDKKGVVWCGTNKGLTKFDGVNWKTYDKSNSPLPGDIVKALKFDVKENLWIGTTNGVAEFNELGIVK